MAQVVNARIALALDCKLNRRQEADLWQLIETGERCLQMTAHDFPAQLEQIDRELEAEFTPSTTFAEHSPSERRFRAFKRTHQ